MAVDPGGSTATVARTGGRWVIIRAVAGTPPVDRHATPWSLITAPVGMPARRRG